MLAAGGTTGARQFISGDPRVDGRPNPEMVRIIDPGPRTRTEVTPLTAGAFAQNRGRVPMFAEGTRSAYLSPVARPTLITTQPISPVSVGSSPPPPSTTNLPPPSLSQMSAPPVAAPVATAPVATAPPVVNTAPTSGFPSPAAAPVAREVPLAAASVVGGAPPDPFAVATATNAGVPYNPITAADQPYLDRVAALRATARPAAQDAFRRMMLVNYGRTSPTLRAADYATIQTGLGIPGEDMDFYNQHNRFAGSGYYGSPVVAY